MPNSLTRFHQSQKMGIVWIIFSCVLISFTRSTINAWTCGGGYNDPWTCNPYSITYTNPTPQQVAIRTDLGRNPRDACIVIEPKLHFPDGSVQPMSVPMTAPRCNGQGTTIVWLPTDYASDAKRSKYCSNYGNNGQYWYEVWRRDTGDGQFEYHRDSSRRFSIICCSQADQQCSSSVPCCSGTCNLDPDGNGNPNDTPGYCCSASTGASCNTDADCCPDPNQGNAKYCNPDLLLCNRACAQPTISLTSPTDQATFTRSNSQMYFNWDTNFNCINGSTHSVGVYSDPGYNTPVPDTPPFPRTMSISRGNASYGTILTTTPTCGTYYWRVKAKNSSGAEVSEYRRFTVTDTRPTLTSLELPQECGGGNIITAHLDHAFANYSFRINVTGPNGYTFQQTRSPSGTSVVFDLSGNPPTTAGVYTVQITSLGNSCYAGDTVITSTGTTFTVGASEIASLNLTTIPEGAEFQVVADVSSASFDEGNPADVTFEMAMGCDDACGACTYGPLPAPHPSTYSCPNEYAPGNPLFKTLCETDQFPLTVAGTYCFRASAAIGCGLTTMPSPVKVSIFDVHLKKDTDSTLNCNNETEGKEGDPITGETKEVNLSIAGGAFYTNDTDPGTGIATFALDHANIPQGSPNITVNTQCAGCIPDDVCKGMYADCGGVSGFPNSFTEGDRGGVFYSTPDGTLTVDVPRKYDIYMRVDTYPKPEDWLSSEHGDVFAPLMDIPACTETTTQTVFDGSLIERSEGSPYGKPGQVTAPEPYTGGFVFKHIAGTPGEVIEKLHIPGQNPRYYITEPDPVGRYALALQPVDDTGFEPFRDTDFSAKLQDGLIVPENAVDLNDNVLANNTIYKTADIASLIDGGTYSLAENGAAVIYYTPGSGDSEPIVLGKDTNQTTVFTNSNTQNASLVIVTDQDVSVLNTVGYGCRQPNPILNPDYYECGLPGKEFSPSATQTPPSIAATIISYGNIDIENYSGLTGEEGAALYPDDINAVRLIKFGGALIAGGDDGIGFKRKLGELSVKYPSEFVSYDSNILYRFTKMDRNADRPKTGFSTSSVKIDYGY